MISSRIKNTGFLGYHWRYWAWGQSHWVPARQQLARWLIPWMDGLPVSELIWIGSSGGYLTDLKAIALKITKITAIEPDPWARRILSHRLRRANYQGGLHFLPQAAWTFDPIDLTPLERILKQNPRAGVYFSNVLGQQRFCLPEHLHDPEPMTRELFRQVGSLIQARSWMSFHDLISIRLAKQGPVAIPEATDFSLAALAQRSAPALSERMPDPQEWLDHLTGGFCPESRIKAAIPWWLTSKDFHWLGVQTNNSL